MKQKITMQTVAEALGLSKFSVSQALSGKPGISEDTRAQVWEMARRLGYTVKRKNPGPANAGIPEHPDPAAAADNSALPGSGFGYRFVLIWVRQGYQAIPAYWSRVLDGAVQGCRSFGWEHVIVSPPENMEALPFPDYVDRASCAGCLILGSMPAPSVAPLLQSGLPLVWVDHEEPLSEGDCIMNDNIGGARSIARYAKSKDWRRVVFLGSPRFSVSFRERWDGLRAEWEALEAEDRSDGNRPSAAPGLLQWDISYEGSDWVENLQRRINESAAAHAMPDAFVCANDQIALQAMTLLREAGIPVPGGCAVVGFDNVAEAAYASPPLTTVDFAKEALGFRATEALERRLRYPGAQKEKLLLSSRFIPRSSG